VKIGIKDGMSLSASVSLAPAEETQRYTIRFYAGPVKWVDTMDSK
jgi:hypothetical protein